MHLALPTQLTSGSWLSSSPVAGADGLQWWAAMPTHPLHRMAMNFLSIPGVFFKYYAILTAVWLFCVATSTDVERAFSRGGLTVSKMRHSLSDKSTQAAAVIGSWCDFPGAIPREEIMEAFKDKSKRGKGKDRSTIETEDPDIEIL